MLNLELLAKVSSATDVISNSYDLGDVTTYSIQAIFTENSVTTVGSLKLQGSVDNTYWADISGSTQAVNAAAPDDYSHVWSGSVEGYRYVRAVWDYTSGTSNITIKMFIKQPIVK